MSSIAYRQRLRDRAANEALARTLANNPDQVVEDHNLPKLEEELPVDAKIHDTKKLKETATTLEEPPEELRLQDDPIMATREVEEDDNRGRAPDELRLQAQTTAQVLAGLEADDYQQSLADLEKNDPTLYAVVCDELQNMWNEQQAEGDDYDLSDIAGGGLEDHDSPQ